MLYIIGAKVRIFFGLCNSGRKKNYGEFRDVEEFREVREFKDVRASSLISLISLTSLISLSHLCPTLSHFVTLITLPPPLVTL